MNFCYNYLRNIVLFLLRSIILIIYFFFLTRGYFLFVFFVLFGMLCDVNDSLLHLFSKVVLYFTIFSTLFLTIILNVYFLGKRVQFFIGRDFLNRYFPGPLKGLLALALFIGTISLLDSINTLSLIERRNEYELSLDHFSEEINQTEDMEWGEDFLTRLQSIEFEIKEKVPLECPTKGFLTDYTNRFVHFFR